MKNLSVLKTNFEIADGLGISINVVEKIWDSTLGSAVPVRALKLRYKLPARQIEGVFYIKVLP